MIPPGGQETAVGRIPARFAARLLLALALAVVLHEAIEPAHAPAVTVGRDDLEHALWGYLLTILGVAAFPRIRALVVAGGLLALSAVAEAVQAWVGRSTELSDWLGSAAGVAAALLPMTLLWVRERLLRGRSWPAADAP